MDTPTIIPLVPVPLAFARIAARINYTPQEYLAQLALDACVRVTGATDPVEQMEMLDANGKGAK